MECSKFGMDNGFLTETLSILLTDEQIWDLFEDHHLFNGVYTDGEYCPYKHMAKIVAFLGPPPAEFVGRSEITKNCVDSEGEWTI